MELAIIGAGHVGIVCGASLAAIGHHVKIMDIDQRRVALLRAGQMPFVEPGLDRLVARGVERGCLSFHSGPADALGDAEVIFLCVNTDNLPDGSVDLSPIESGVQAISSYAQPEAILVNRSTAPVGTAEYIRSLIAELRGAAMFVAVNPEFLAEGSAIRDFLAPDRIVVGAWEQQPVSAIAEVYGPIVEHRLPAELQSSLDGQRSRAPVGFLVADPASAELAKYAANSALAVKISFINEIARIAEQLGADVTKVAEAVGLDSRIGPSFLRAGIGWGGSCFPKDIVTLEGIAQTRGLNARMLRAANDINSEQRSWVLRRLLEYFGTLAGRRVGLLGLAFKAGIDDLRNAPSLEIADQLHRANVRVRAFDPVVRSVPLDLRDKIRLVESLESLADNADAIVLVTEWPEFANIEFSRLRRAMRTPLLLDGRNFFDPNIVRSAGFVYLGVGRGTTGPERLGANIEIPHLALNP